MTNARRLTLEFRTPVRGHRFAAPPPGSAGLRIGAGAGLIREPDHPLDPYAVAVWARDAKGRPWRVGYLERAVAARLAPRLDAGQSFNATIEGWLPEPHGRWQRPLLHVVPTRTRVTRTDPFPEPRPARARRRRVR